jgi:hypothetical protein
MTINLTARGTRLTVGGKDFSKALVSGSVSDALIDQSGVVLRSGELELARVAGLDESLDPRLNLIRWARGVEVLIELKTQAGDWAKLPCQELYVLNAQPNDSQGARLTLELGCWLSLNEWQTSTDPENEEEFTEEQSLPKVHDRQDLVTSLLGRLGVTGLSGATLTGEWIGSVATDLQGGYLEKAGQLAYSSEQPCYLIAEAKAVRAVPIDLAPAPFHQVAIGVGEKAYEPQTAEPPVERYVCTANPLVEKPSSDWEREGGCVSRRYSDSSGSEFWQFCPGFPVSRETYRLEEPETVLNPDSASTTLRLSQRRVRQKTWAEDDRRLLREEEVVYRPRVAVLSGAYGELNLETPDPWGTMIAERTIVTYSYDPVTRVISQRRSVTEKTLAEIAPRIVAQYSLSANFTALRDADSHVQQWFRDPQGRWVATERKLRSRNLAQPQVVDALEALGTYDMINVACNLVRIPLGEGGAQPSAAGASQPPATEYYSDLTEADKYESKALKGVANFEPVGGSKYRPQKVVEDVPLAQTAGALAACARVGGSLLLGRHQGASLQILVADKFLGPGYLPLKRIDVLDRQSVKSFLADGAIWAFSQTEALLGFAHLCWLGTAPYAAPTGVSGATIQISTAGTGLVVGSELRFAAVPGGGLPPNLEGDRPYYVVAVSPTGIQVAETPGGAPILPGAPPPAPALPPADGFPLPGGGAIDPAPAFGGASFVVVPATAITVPYNAFESVLNPVVTHLVGLRLGAVHFARPLVRPGEVGLRLGARHGVGRSALHRVGLGLGVAHTMGARVPHPVGLRLGAAHGAAGGRIAVHSVGLGLGMAHLVTRAAAHRVGLGLGAAHGVGRSAVHSAGLGLGAAHDTAGGRTASHPVGLGLGVVHTSVDRAEHRVGLGLGAAHGVGRSAIHSVGLGLGAAHGVGRSAIHVVGLRLGVVHSIPAGDAGELLATARSLGSTISVNDAAVLLALADEDLEVALALVPDL